MKTKYFTIADGPFFGYMADQMRDRLMYLNGIDLVIIKDDVAKIHGCLNEQYWLKAFLWDFAGYSDRIMYFDSDILPIEPLPNCVMNSQAVFAARLDVEATGISQRLQHPLFRGIKKYFNNGFFVAHRESIETIFEPMKEAKSHPIRASCIEQTWMNKIVDECGYPLTVLPNSVCWMPKGEPIPEDGARMIHYAGYNAPAKLGHFQNDKGMYPCPR